MGIVVDAKKYKTQNSKEPGQSLAELAISFTFLLLLFGGAIDLGRMFFTYVALWDAAQEGATYASYKPTSADETQIKARVRASADDSANTFINTGSIDTGSGTGTIEIIRSASACPGNGITIRVSTFFKPMMPMLGAFINGNRFPLSAAATETILQSNDSVCP